MKQWKEMDTKEEGQNASTRAISARVAFAVAGAPHQIAVSMYDLLVLDDVLATKGVQRVEEGLPVRARLGDHPAHSARRQRHRRVPQAGYGRSVHVVCRVQAR